MSNFAFFIHGWICCGLQNPFLQVTRFLFIHCMKYEDPRTQVHLTNGLNASVFTIGNSVEAVNGINNGLGTFVQTYKDELS